MEDKLKAAQNPPEPHATNIQASSCYFTRLAMLRTAPSSTSSSSSTRLRAFASSSAITLSASSVIALIQARTRPHYSEGKSNLACKYADGLLIPDGRVVFVPDGVRSPCNRVGLYDPSTDAWSQSKSVRPERTSYFQGVFAT